MRLPGLEWDGFELISAEQKHAESPETFWIPLLSERQNLPRGAAAKLLFTFDLEGPAGQIERWTERMWVIVAEQVGNAYIGILDSSPRSFELGEDEYLAFGVEIPFQAQHISDIASPSEEYVEWQLSQPPERRWPRDPS